MFFKLRNTAARAIYDWRVRDILNTQPLKLRPAPLLFCSMLRERDLLMYLVAIKSVYLHIGEGSICIINDGSLSAESIAILNQHLGSPTIVPISSIDTGLCPRGGTWERLLHIVRLSQDNYVIQVDADILARSELREVIDCYRANRCFTLGNFDGQEFLVLHAAAEAAAAQQGDHVQDIAERAFAAFDEADGLQYVRGSSGFAGFARGAVTRQQAEALSTRMQQLIGSRWSEWGSEQVASNYLIANSHDSYVLPWPKYSIYAPTSLLDESDLVHFIGEWRFRRGCYIRESRAIIRHLQQSGRKSQIRTER